MSMDCLLTLSLPPAQEALLTDWLFEQGFAGFSSWQGWGHTSDPSKMTLREQIQGKENRVFVALHLEAAQADRLLHTLSACYPHLNVHFWTQPVMKAGSLQNIGESGNSLDGD